MQYKIHFHENDTAPFALCGLDGWYQKNPNRCTRDIAKVTREQCKRLLTKRAADLRQWAREIDEGLSGANR